MVHNQLTTKKVASLTAPGRYVDGLGLMLRVDNAQSRRWILRVTINGKRSDIGLGSTAEVSLAEARRQRDEIRQQLRNGHNPLDARRRRDTAPTFERFAERFFDQIQSDFKNDKHRAQWISTVRRYAYPILARRSVPSIDGALIQAVLEPIWLEKAETARRLKQRLSRIMDAAIAENLHDGPNPVPAATATFARARPKPKHFAAMPYKDVPVFVSALRASRMALSSRLAFELLILTATRTSEVLGMEWSEVDLDAGFWTVPAQRIKMGREHVIPLSEAARRCLGEQAAISPGGRLVFPGRASQAPLSNMVFLQALKRMKQPYTAHGFRSSFRDWAEEQTNHSYAVKEAALAHAVTSKVEAAYRRTTLLRERCVLMQDWGEYVDDAAE